MIPEEKAKELFSKFEKLVLMTNGDSWTYEAKECALIAVDEIIDCTHSQDIVESAILKGNSDKYCYEYWQQVKTEIEKIK